MAWYTIDHECGHTERHQIPGSNSGGQRDRRADGLRHTECSACAAEARQADRQARDAAAAGPAAPPGGGPEGGAPPPGGGGGPPPGPAPGGGG
ncbi:hypothetical protein, partial [Nocardia asiatica]|uniref:hypothetical protein n=1 Tax=Nocardia asiatica TaxID=209252 RepID=UPI0024581E1D